jgi:hypothetical protein
LRTRLIQPATATINSSHGCATLLIMEDSILSWRSARRRVASQGPVEKGVMRRSSFWTGSERAPRGRSAYPDRGCYWVRRRLQPNVWSIFAEDIARGAYRLEHLTADDLMRVAASIRPSNAYVKELADALCRAPDSRRLGEPRSRGRGQKARRDLRLRFQEPSRSRVSPGKGPSSGIRLPMESAAA